MMVLFKVRMVPSSVINLASLVNSDPNNQTKEVPIVIFYTVMLSLPSYETLVVIFKLKVHTQGPKQLQSVPFLDFVIKR